MTSMFVTVVSGVAPLLTEQLEAMPGVHVTGTGFDGRSDVVLFEVERGHRDAIWSLRTIEDLFIEIGRTGRSPRDRPRQLAERVWRPDRVERALSVRSSEVRPLTRAMTYRVIARVLQERTFLRTGLRRALADTIAADRPKWRIADPAQIEVWVSEYRPGQIVGGLRLSDVTMRQHNGRAEERHGALRPSVAAMMVSRAGEPTGTLVDPCCGSGTILQEAMAAGWPHVRGGDIDPNAVATARSNAVSAQVDQWDVRHLNLPDASVSAVVSNLPFGRQFEIDGSMEQWLSETLTEMTRVARTGSHLVLLAPSIPADAIPPGVRLVSRDAIRLLGTPTVLWVFARD